jgi:hypothetical protein
VSKVSHADAARGIKHSRQTIAHYWTKNKVVPVSAHFLPAQTWRINYSAAMKEPFARFRPTPWHLITWKKEPQVRVGIP